MKKQYLNANDIQDILGCSHSHALKLIRNMNLELKSKNYLTIAGKVPSAFFCEKWYGYDK